MNVIDNAKGTRPLWEKQVMPLLHGTTTETLEALDRLQVTAEEKEGLVCMELGGENYLTYQSIMGFEMGMDQFTFQSVEAFRQYCKIQGIQGDFDNLTDKSVVMTSRMANNRGVKIGDSVKKVRKGENLIGEYVLGATIDKPYYMAFYIDSECFPGMFLILNEGLSDEAFEEFLEENAEDDSYSLYSAEGFEEAIDDAIGYLPMIYFGVVALFALILAITINAIFVGTYQSREFEFAVYAAIGMGRGRIRRKIVGEIFWINGIALLVGGVVFLIVLYLCNELLLYPQGLYMKYFSVEALLGLVICNIVILIPLILSRCRQIRKIDVCNY